MILRPYQVAAIDAVRARYAAGDRSTLIVLPTGCHRAGQTVIAASGHLVRVEDVAVGDALAGPTGPRRVLSLSRGRSAMYEVRPVKGDPWVVDGDHVLTLVRTNDGTPRAGEIVDVTVCEWLGWSRTARHVHKLVRAGADFTSRPVPRIAPYVLGVMIGDGALKNGIVVSTPDLEIWDDCRREAAQWGLNFSDRTQPGKCPTFAIGSAARGPGANPLLDEIGALGLRVLSEHKRVPDEYRLGSRATRLDVLAGLLDTDGHMTNGGYDFISKSPQLSDDVAFVARSLGLAAYVRPCRKACQTGAVGDYYRVSISGDCSVVPCRVPRKRAPPRQQVKDALCTGFDVVPTGTVEDFYGFTLDGDHRYLLGDFTVTHNCGKTVVFAEMARRVARGGGRTLVLAHRTELVDQALEKLHAAGVRAAAEQGARRVRTAGAVDCVVASVQTLRGDRLLGWQPDAFALGVVDEAHHAPAKAYGDVVAHFRGARWLGVTATPDRLDGAALGHVFESCAYTYEMRDAIRDGYLSPLTALRVDVPTLDLRQVATRAGDLAQDQLGAKMLEDDSLHAIAAPLAELSRGRRTVAFAVNVAHAHALAAVLCWYEPGCARAAHGGMAPADRAAVLRDFRAGRFRVLVNCALYTEGFDEPSIACVAVARPTKSRALYAQMVGRGTRIAPGKRDCLVLDFVGQAGRHRLMNPADVLAGGALNDADRGDAESVLAEAGDGIDVGALLAELAKRREVRPVQYRTREVKMGLSAEELRSVVDLFSDVRPPGAGILEFFAARNTPGPRGV